MLSLIHINSILCLSNYYQHFFFFFLIRYLVFRSTCLLPMLYKIYFSTEFNYFMQKKWNKYENTIENETVDKWQILSHQYQIVFQINKQSFTISEFQMANKFVVPIVWLKRKFVQLNFNSEENVIKSSKNYLKLWKNRGIIESVLTRWFFQKWINECIRVIERASSKLIQYSTIRRIWKYISTAISWGEKIVRMKQFSAIIIWIFHECFFSIYIFPYFWDIQLSWNRTTE